MAVKIIDNFYPDSIIEDLIREEIEWEFCRFDVQNDIYWTKHIYGAKFSNPPRVIEHMNCQKTKSAWDFFSEKFSLSIDNLYSCYINGLTFGVEAYPHIDDEREDCVTVICYLCDSWNSHWAGPTVFYSGDYKRNLNTGKHELNPAHEIYYKHDIVSSVLPRRNRICIFKSSILHSVHPVSKSFKGIRKTLMFKLNNVSYEDIFANAT
jgi:hypothetical protein